jgi:hypothetical protein
VKSSSEERFEEAFHSDQIQAKRQLRLEERDSRADATSAAVSTNITVRAQFLAHYWPSYFGILLETHFLC